MADRQWYAAIGGERSGPYSDERLRELIAAGSVRADTLVWCEGMREWAKAAEVPGLFPQSMNPPPLPAAGAGGAAQALSTTVGVWPLFGRLVLLVVCQILIIPAPWAVANFLRWFVDHVEVPGGRRVSFAGKAGDVWYVFVLSALCAYVDLAAQRIGSETDSAAPRLVPLAVFFLTAFLALVALRWFYANLVWEGRATALQFTGGYWPMLGWSLLAPLSFITIIGWAWVYTAWGRWMCRHVEGSSRRLVFTASGWGYLWRTVVLVLLCMLIVPIPWMVRWYTRWIVSQFALA